jgi:hypothetical protein
VRDDNSTGTSGGRSSLAGCPPYPIGDHIMVLLGQAAQLWLQFGPMVMHDGEWMNQADIGSTSAKRFLWAAEAAWDKAREGS